MPTEAILRLQNAKLFKLLLQKEGDDHQLSSRIVDVVKLVSPLLQRIPENMREYTLHDSSHSAKIVEIMGKILPDEVLDSLNVVEFSLLILSAYLHDIGMTCEKEERESIIESDEDFKILFKSDVDILFKYEQYVLVGNNRAATFIQDQIFTEYLRRNHVKRSSDYISSVLSQGECSLVFNQIPFYKLLIKVCDAHGEPVRSLYDIQRWPRQTLIGDSVINVQFIAIILRLADIIDLDSERTPKVIYEFVSPENPVSILEWKKHRSVIGASIGQNQVVFEAECSSPEVERALRQFLDWIEIERKESLELLNSYHGEERQRYFLRLNDPITKDRIQSDGSYVYNDLSFSLDFHRIMSLLMGQKLYKDTATALREVLQNSLDAISARLQMYSGRKEKFTPSIEIVCSDSELVIKDNGIGMSESVFRDFFLQIGKSYYSSPKFYAKYSTIDLTSEFGIGILSVFMIASSITIISRKDPENPLDPFLPIHYEIPTAHGYIVQRKGTQKEVGTQIIMKLLDSNPFKSKTILGVIEQILPRPPFPISITENNETKLYSGKADPFIPKLEYSTENVKNFFRANNYFNSYWETSYTHCWMDVELASEPNPIIGIAGVLKIVNSNPINYYATLSGNLCQRNFSVGVPETDKNIFKIKTTDAIRSLFPKWISAFLSINLTGKSCLSINPERSDLLLDEKHNVLKLKIEQKIILAIKKHFDEYELEHGLQGLIVYVEFLFAAGFFGIDLDEYELSERSKEFMLSYVHFPVLHSDGVVKKIRSRDIVNSKNLAVIIDRWDHKNMPELLEFIKRNELTLVILPEMTHYAHRIESLFCALLSQGQHFISPIATFLRPIPSSPIHLVRKGYETAFNTRLRSRYDQINAISNSEDIEKDFSVVFMLKWYDVFPIYNVSHPLIFFLFLEEANLVARKKVLDKLTDGIVLAIKDSVSIMKNSDDKALLKIAYDDQTVDKLMGILDFDPDLFGKLASVFRNAAEAAFEAKIIANIDSIPILSIDDLPWYWKRK
jgi:molecular chaperone HtpG